MKSLLRLIATSLVLTGAHSSPFGSDKSTNTRNLELPPKPDCEPEFSLVGATTEAINVQGAPFKATIPCSSLHPEDVFVFVNGKAHHDFQVSGSEVSFSNGLNSSTVVLGIIAADTQGYPFVSTFSIRFGSSTPNLAFTRSAVETAFGNSCTTCGDCKACGGYPMCQKSCQQPQPRQCNFYQTCIEGSVPCSGSSDSYAINYGLKNCQKFEQNLNLFSARGEQFIWGTMNCLQKDLVPLVSSCKATCKSIHNKAFASHAPCYLANGFCSLTCSDYLAELYTVGLDLFTKDAIKSVFQTAGGCLGRIEQIIQEGACMNEALKAIVLTILRLLSK